MTKPSHWYVLVYRLSTSAVIFVFEREGLGKKRPGGGGGGGLELFKIDRTLLPTIRSYIDHSGGQLRMAWF